MCSSCKRILCLSHTLEKKYTRTAKFKESLTSVWKYLHNLIPSKSIISLNEGGTPLRISNIGNKLNLTNLMIKDETRNPTGSIMDRGMTAEISVLAELSAELGTNNSKKYTAVVGVLASSLAAYCARAGLPCEVIVPKGNEWKVTPSRLYQLIAYNAEINFVPKDFVLSSSDYYHVKTNNIIFMEGLKTTGFEICDQLEWELPDHIIVPVGSGFNLSAISQSINELIKLGLAKNDGPRKRDERLPKIHGVTVGTSTSSSSYLELYEDINSGTEIRNRFSNKLGMDGPTIAPELVSSVSSYLEHAIAAINVSGGTMTQVHNHDLINSVSLLASHDGILASPTGAAAVAGLLNLVKQKVIERDDNVVCIVTGSGEVSNISGVRGDMTDWKMLKAYNKIRQSPSSSPITSRVDYSNTSIIANNLGITKIRIISLIDKESDYAYSLNKRLHESFIDKTKDKRKMMMAMSTLYQHLNELERFGLIVRTKAESFRGRPIRFHYRITAGGKRALKTEVEKYKLTLKGHILHV